MTPDTGTPDTYVYDANGNMTCRLENGASFIQGYNAENRLSVVQKVATGDCTSPLSFAAVWNFAYDGDGTRVAQAYTPYDESGNPGTPVFTEYFMGGAYEVTDGAVRKYYAIAGMTVALNDGSGLQYLLTDHLGSIVAVTDASGTLTSQQRYLPFGEVRTDVGSIAETDFSFTGQRSLDAQGHATLGLLDYHARFYDAALGRFISPDSLIPPGGPQNLNRYSYVLNSPIVFVDPTGHYCVEEDENGNPVRADCDTGEIIGSGGSSGSDGGTTSGGIGGSSGGNESGINIDIGIIEFGINWDDENLRINYRFGNEYCDSYCQRWAEALSIGATVVDTFAAGANLTMALIVDGAVVINPAVGFALYLAWRDVSIGTNSIGSVGTFAWAAQGFLTGKNMTSGDITFSKDAPALIKSIDISGKISQDTMASGLLDAVSWMAPEPNSAAAVSVAGAGYDIFRNPAPSLLPYTGIPSPLDISYRVSIGFP